ncbi:Rne/Rng family ribonuclease [Agromyces sp. ISL-38]|uniref:Rne/Rng family ribonuclease n=1 Tax=Agromyces sp. ISL-38 TaxID=2819107 RepID=UPI001BE58496|nr:Rne/Rng family ribonuclease [Agromyces sp. ISL-38]MBT2499968.1 Rne/Rng family ribonuclease [Agromyces sp. ISL-38]
MVEGNEKNNNEPETGSGAPKRRGGLFGARRSARSRAGQEQRPAATLDPTPPPIEVTDAATPEAVLTAPALERTTAAAGGGDVTSGRSAGVTVSDDVAASDTDGVPAAAKRSPIPAVLSTTSLIFHAPPVLVTPEGEEPQARGDRPERGERQERGGAPEGDEPSSVRRRTRRRSGEEGRTAGEESANTVVKVRKPREPELITEPQKVKGSTRLEAKKQRRRDGRDAGRRRTVITEAEFLARRESVDRKMVVRSKAGRIQIGVLEDGVLVEHYVARNQESSLIGNVYLGRVQNVLPSMEAAFVDIGRGRNAVLYSGEVDWDAAAENGQANQPRRIELALKPGDRVLVQVTKDPIGHKGARLTSQVSLPGRYLVYVPNGSMNGISRKLPDTERARLKKILKEVLPDNVGVIVRTAAEGATEEQLTLDVNRLIAQWADISSQLEKVQAPALLHSEPDLLIKIVRDVFNEDFQQMVIAGDEARQTIESYVRQVAPDLLERMQPYEGERDAFDEFRISEQIEKALDRKVWLPSGGSLVIDRTEAMTVIDVNTGKFVGSGGNLEETVTKNNLEAAEEIVRQLRLRDIGGIIVVDFIDMVLESNRDLVLRRLVECLSRDRTKHQVAEVTSLGLVQMTRKKLGLGLLESFSEPCEVCAGRGIIVHHEPVVKHRQPQQQQQPERRRGRGGAPSQPAQQPDEHKAQTGTHAITDDVKHALAQIAASTIVHPEQKPETAASNAVSTTRSADKTGGAPAASTARTAGGRRSRHRRVTQEQGAAEHVSAAEPSGSTATAPADDLVHDAVQLLDLPVPPAERKRPARAPEAEVLLDSVLDALPAPKKAGEGRARSRRVSTAALSGAGGAPVITRADGSDVSESSVDR